MPPSGDRRPRVQWRRLTGQRLTSATHSNGSRPIGAKEIRPSLLEIPLSMGRSARLAAPLGVLVLAQLVGVKSTQSRLARTDRESR